MENGKWRMEKALPGNLCFCSLCYYFSGNPRKISLCAQDAILSSILNPEEPWKMENGEFGF
jgi:hypothetical protein